jgi:hypothetical protein
MPRVVSPATWLVLASLTAAEALYEILGGSGRLVTVWIHGFVIAAAAVLCLARGLVEPRGRGAPAVWLGAGLACWWAGDAVWNTLWGTDPDPPYPSVADLFWLAWYPLTATGIALLIRDHVAGFELHRWMDGVAVMLVVLTPFAALLLEPAFGEAHGSDAARVVTFSYPVLDSLMIGAVVGVYGLLAFHAGRAWLLLGAGCVCMALADGLFAVQDARPSVLDDRYEFLWSGGALLIAYAVWQAWDPPKALGRAYGWRAIALPLAAQALAAAIQIYGIFHDLGPVERVVTLVVLLIAMVQIVVSRPRAPAS